MRQKPKTRVHYGTIHASTVCQAEYEGLLIIEQLIKDLKLAQSQSNPDIPQYQKQWLHRHHFTNENEPGDLNQQCSKCSKSVQHDAHDPTIQKLIASRRPTTRSSARIAAKTKTLRSTVPSEDLNAYRNRHQCEQDKLRIKRMTMWNRSQKIPEDDSEQDERERADSNQDRDNYQTSKHRKDARSKPPRRFTTRQESQAKYYQNRDNFSTGSDDDYYTDCTSESSYASVPSPRAPLPWQLN